MKKLLFVCAVLILSGISCKKICACSPAYASLFLIVKNDIGKDVFNPSTSGYYAKDRLSFYAEDVNGKIYAIRYDINPPIPSKLSDYQIRVADIPAIVSSSNKIYLKFGSLKAHELTLTLSKDLRKIDQLLINGKNIPADKRSGLSSLFYFSL